MKKIELLKTTKEEIGKFRKRCLSGLIKSTYNCGGYALGTFNWYRPYDYEKEGLEYVFRGREEELITYMEKDFEGNLRRINSLEDLKQGERAVAFSCSLGDFHYIRRGDNGIWYDKMGSSYYINKHSEEWVMKGRWYGRYSKKVYLLAIKERVYKPTNRGINFSSAKKLFRGGVI